MITGKLNSAAALLHAAGIETPQLDARLLMQEALGCTHETLVAGDAHAFTPEEETRFQALLARRLKREPLSHILGRREFWGMEFMVTPDVLTPRADTETLVEAVLAVIGNWNFGNWSQKSAIPITNDQLPITILDLGTGTGCLLLALLSELPGARGTGVDLSPAALHVAGENAKRLKMQDRAKFIQSRWGEALGAKKYEIVVANPPYIASNAVRQLMPEVAEYEPHLALDGGEDGLQAYREIAGQLPLLITDETIVAMEVGAGQHDDVARIFTDHGLSVKDVRQDLAGIPRVLVFKNETKNG